MDEKNYWIILIVGFTCFALIIWYYLIPLEILEYNLAVNLLTSSIFMVLTIILLTWIINLQNNQKWEKVKSAVYREIGVALGHIFRSIVPYYEHGTIDWFRFNRLRPGTEKAFQEHITKLLKGEIKLDEQALKVLFKPELREREFLQFSYKLSEIESKYFQFLEPEIVESLIKIETELSHLENIVNFAVVVPAFFGAIKEQGIVDSNQIPKTPPKIDIEPMVANIFTEILKEMKKLQKSGIPIYKEEGINLQ